MRNAHEVITDGVAVINTYTVRYIKNPTKMNVNTDATVEFDEKEIDNIIDLAIAKAMQTLINNGQVKGTSVRQEPEEE